MSKITGSEKVDQVKTDTTTDQHDKEPSALHKL